ncbi:MAG: hypothetical protein P8Y67_12165 [Alphaproteobacteria bacterium]
MQLLALKSHLKPTDQFIRKAKCFYKNMRQKSREHFLYSGLSAYINHDIDGAILILEIGLKKVRDSEVVLEHYLRICYENGQFGRAMDFVTSGNKHITAAFHRLIELAPSQEERRPAWLTDELMSQYSRDPRALWQLANLLEHAGQHSKAREIYFSLSKQPLELAEDYIYTGLSELRLGNYGACFDALRIAAIKHPREGDFCSAIKLFSEYISPTFDYDRLLQLHTSALSTCDIGKSIPAFKFYLDAIAAIPLEMFILKYRNVEDNCNADEFHLLTDAFLTRVSNSKVSLEKARQLLILSRHLDIDEKFTRKLLQILLSKDWYKNTDANKYILRLIIELTLPIGNFYNIDTKAAAISFSKSACTTAKTAMQLKEPLSEFGKEWSLWYGLFCLCQPQIYRHAISAFENLAFKLWPKLDYIAPHIHSSRLSQTGSNKKIRIGFTVLDAMPMMSGLMQHLNRNIFETIYLRPGVPGTSKVATDWIARADKTVEYSDEDAYSAINTIANQHLDILVSGPSVPQIFFPLMARLAHLQIVLLEPNWPDGIKNHDYYISWKNAEPEHCEDFYKSPVALLNHPPYWIEHPSLEEKSAVAEAAGDKIRRKLLGDTSDDRFYICPNTPPKILPQMDQLFYNILERDPRCFIVLLRCDSPFAAPLKARLKKSLGAFYERIKFLDSLQREDAHALILSADCCLDSYPISGMSSSFDSLMLGVPIVTLPTDIPFGKWTAAIYDYLDVSGLTARNADEYIRIATRLASDKDWRQSKSIEIKKKASRYIESKASFDEFEHFIIEAWRRKQAGLPPANWVAGKWSEFTAAPQVP